jgi:hypothetical protein
VSARGYRTAASLDEVPKAFAKWQRRVGLVIPSYSPDGVSVSYQLRPDKPIVRKTGKAPKYESPSGAATTLDVNPLMMTEVCSGTRDLVITEGCKKVDALASRGVPAIGVCGVHMGAVPGTKGTVPLGCWGSVRKDRRMIIVYDADARTNSGVQLGLERMAAMLEGLGATVLVAYPPAVDGDGKTGVDDYLAAGGDLDDLLNSAKPFEPVNVGHERLSRDEALRRTVAELWATWEALPVTTQGQCTVRSVVRALIEHAEEHGKPSGDGGLEVSLSLRTLAKNAGISQQTVSKTMERVEESGIAIKSQKRRKPKEAQTYVLVPNAPGGARKVDTREGRTPEEESQERETKRDSLTYGRYDPCVNLARGDRGGFPVLRQTKVTHQWERIDPPKGGKPRWRVVASEVVARLGKRRGEVIRLSLLAGSWLDIASEVMPRCATPKTRLRDFRRRVLADLQGFRIKGGERIELGPQIIEVNEAGTHMRLVPQWFENLRVVREAADEIEDEKLQADKIARQRERFHNPPPKADPVPGMPSLAEKRRMLEEAEARDAVSRIAEQRSKVGMTVEVFVYDALARLGHIRLGLLREAWGDMGGDPRHVWKAVQSMQCKLERLTLYGNALFVFPPSERENPEPAEVVDLRPRVPEPEPTLKPEPERPSSNDCLDLGCDCLDCSARAPRYARPYQAGGVR